VRRVRQYQGGFIITLELILVSTILVIGTFIGVVALRDVLFKQYVEKQSRDIYVSDSNGVVLGQAISFDEHEAPRIPYIDRMVPPLSPDPTHRNYRALISIRDDRFTTREAVYYDGANCTGTPCIKAPSDENEDNIGIDNIDATGAVGYLYKSQDGPTYAIGRSPNGITGYLFRDTGNACPISPEAVKSRYMSQKVVTGSPCESLGSPATTSTTTTTQTDVADAYTECLIGPGAPELPGGVVETCSCPNNYSDQNDVVRAAESEIIAAFEVGLRGLQGFVGNALESAEILALSVGTVCCPSGSVLSNTGLADTVAYTILADAITTAVTDVSKQDRALEDLSASLTPQTLVCVEETTTTNPGTGRPLVLREAISVLAPDSTDNALANFSAPFKINLPVDASTDDWVYTLPGKEGPNN
jgi:hypothetical protein